MSETTVGREPVQILSIKLPRCANTFGNAPCTATGSGDAKCLNTFATCKDRDNYRVAPEGGMGLPDDTFAQNDDVADSVLTTDADLFAAFDVNFGLSPTGTIWCQGSDADNAVYLGVTGTNLVFRVGDGTTGTPTNGVRLTTPLVGLTATRVTLLVEIDVSASSATLWSYDRSTYTLTELATGVAAGSFTTWAGTAAGAIGTEGAGSVAVGEDGGTFTGVITSSRFYHSTAQPDMTVDFAHLLYFGRQQQALPSDNIYILPMLQSVNTVGSKINIAGSDPNYQALGQRAVLDVVFEDSPHTDRIVDPYLSERSYDPFTRGTFWTKFRVREKFGKLGATVTVYEGYAGQALSAMRQRSYIMDRLNVDGSSRVTMRCRDILSRAELRKAQAPFLSPGSLLNDLDNVATSFIVQGATLDDYDTSGTIRINDELMAYSGIVLNADDTLTFTISLRGTENTVAEEHSADDGVQLCLRYTSARVNDVLSDLLIAYADIAPQLLDLAEWKDETDEHLDAYALSTLITEPTGVQKLIGEIAEQCSFFIWWDERDQIVKMRAIRALSGQPDTLNDTTHFIEGSFSYEERPEERVSQIWFYYDQFNPVERLTDVQNFRKLYVDADLNRESIEQYGQRSIRSIFSRWLQSQVSVIQTASRLANRYQDVPVRCTFELDAKDRDIWLGDLYYIEHFMLVNEFGVKASDRFFLITSAEEIVPGEVVRYTAEDATLAGFIYLIVDNAEGDYVGDGTDQFNGAWIGDENGLYSNGDVGAKIT